MSGRDLSLGPNSKVDISFMAVDNKSRSSARETIRSR
jgi:hypothetical protein